MPPCDSIAYSIHQVCYCVSILVLVDAALRLYTEIVYDDYYVFQSLF